MIAYLSGRVVGNLENQIILKIPIGVGYLLNIPTQKVYMINENLEFFVWEVVRENKIELYAFEDLEDRKWAEKLTKVDGVGPKAAATIIFSLGNQKLMEAIYNAETQIISDVKGIGIKTSKKIVLELKGSATDINSLQQTSTNSQVSIDYTDTLSNLGYKRGEIVSTITKLKKSGDWMDDNLVETVKKGLELLGKK
ncbi:MAG: Holliday junction branch migration protein RuvA [Patescibacteria group bacterium]